MNRKNGECDSYNLSNNLPDVMRGIADVPEEYRGVFHPSATAGNPQAEPVTPEEMANQERLNRAAKSTFIKVIDGNGVSHDKDGKFDGGNVIGANLPVQHPNMLKGDGMPKGKIPEIKVGKNQAESVQNAISHLREIWAKPGIIEKGVLVTSDNKIIISETKNREVVSMNPSEKERGGGVLLHSHPIDLPPGSGDIKTFLNNPLKSTFIVTPKHTYSLTKPDQWENKWKQARFNKTFSDIIRSNLMKRGYSNNEASQILNDSADGKYRSELLSKVANEAQIEAVKETAKIMGLKFAITKK